MKQNKVQATLDRLAGRDPADRQRMERSVWYKRWQELASVVESGSKAEIMKAAFALVEDAHGHQKAFIAAASKEALNFVLDIKQWS